MKLNLHHIEGKIKVGIGEKEEYPIQISVSREAFTKIVMCLVMGKRPEGDVRDFTHGMFDNIKLPQDK